MTEEALEPIVPSDPAADGPTPAPSASAPPAPPAPEAPRRRRVSRRALIVWGVVGTLVLAITTTVAAASIIQVPYYRFSPGSLYPTQQMIHVNGVPTFVDGGSINMTTVSSRHASKLDEVLAHFDPTVTLVDQSLIDGDNKPEETQRQNVELMNDAQQVAAVVALRKLGYDIGVSGNGAVVHAVTDDSPAAGVLHPQDTIVAVDGKPVTLADGVITQIGAHHPGDQLTLTVEDLDGNRRDVPVTLAPRPDDASRGFLGVSLGTRNLRYDLPDGVKIDIDARGVTGPSGGLAFTLGVIDLLTPGSLTGGSSVAVTGTMDLDGNVGPVGGVAQKVGAAKRDGIKLFLVPPDEYADAVAAAGGDLTIVAVRTLDEALTALAEHGGDADAVRQLANGTPGSIVPR